MLKDYVIVTLGVLTLLIASAAVYGILNVSEQIQARPQQVKVPDYSAQLSSLQSQINSIENNIATVETLKGKVSDIDQKLSHLSSIQNNITDIQQKIITLESGNVHTTSPPSQETTNMMSLLDKSIYAPGDTIKITAIGAHPQGQVDVELLDSDGFIVVHKNTWADSTGKVVYDLSLSSQILPGSYTVKLISGTQEDSQPLMVDTTAATTNGGSTGSGTLTVQTDKTLYNTGDLIEVYGTASPNTTISGTMKTPSGKIYNSATTVNGDGSYAMFFAQAPPYETGSWSVTVTNLSDTKTSYLTVQQK